MSDGSNVEVVERRVEIEVAGGHELVPGLVWAPAGAAPSEPRPTVLIGHGRGIDKRDRMLGSFARELVADHRWAAVALDAPGHGERRDPAADPAELPPRPDPAQTRDEWRACIDLLVAEGVADPAALGYWGFSMGTGLGIALLAAEPRIRCAALGLMRSTWYDGLVADAARVRCPLIFTLHWDDERAPRAEALELFDAFGSSDKRLHAYPGGHGTFTREEIAGCAAFLAAQLGTAAASA